ncbi:phosphotransferase [Xylanimonas protaetiae]|uniref:phosphotransferase n=1 Tax=Xylanimonas protaetiae TaxID=2509457 RepID=UPI001F5D1B74|nr:phosphotransferase [Xylanimonas protaetiae]
MTSALDLLTGADAGDLLAAALDRAGGELVDWSVRQVDHRPGTSTTVAYRGDVRWSDGVRRETLGASVGRPAHHSAPGVLTLERGERRAAVWLFPDDPGLPALRTAHDEDAVAALLERFGVPAAASRPVDLTLRAYRPTRRAVVEASAPGGRLYLKVLRPTKVDELRRRHDLLTAAGLPVPAVLDSTADGLLVLTPLDGTTMRAAVQSGRPVPSPREVLDLVERLPHELCTMPRRAPWSEHADFYASLIGAALPREAGRAAALADRILDRTVGMPDDAPTHGDLYEAQLLLAGGRVTGLLDVDSAGPGRRADDLACLVAHLETLSLMRGWDGPACAPSPGSTRPRSPTSSTPRSCPRASPGCSCRWPRGRTACRSGTGSARRAAGSTPSSGGSGVLRRAAG